MQVEGLRLLDDLPHPLVLKDSYTPVPHLQSQLLKQVLKVAQDHIFVDLEVHERIDVILALHHEQLDMAPHVQ